MAKTKYRSSKCPYYRKDNGIRLVCEGIIQDMVSVNMIFHDRKSLLAHRGRYCVRCYENCPIKQMVDAKYGNEEGIK